MAELGFEPGGSRSHCKFTLWDGDKMKHALESDVETPKLESASTYHRHERCQRAYERGGSRPLQVSGGKRGGQLFSAAFYLGPSATPF